jgi:hypothetical protein
MRKKYLRVHNAGYRYPLGGKGLDPRAFTRIWNLHIQKQLDPDLVSMFPSASFCKKCVKSSFIFCIIFSSSIKKLMSAYEKKSKTSVKYVEHLDPDAEGYNSNEC